jgi:hypothetical protein
MFLGGRSFSSDIQCLQLRGLQPLKSRWFWIGLMHRVLEAARRAFNNCSLAVENLGNCGD